MSDTLARALELNREWVAIYRRAAVNGWDSYLIPASAGTYVIKIGPAVLQGFAQCTSGATPTWTIYDGTDASGAVLFNYNKAGSRLAVTGGLFIRCTNGLTVVSGGTPASLLVIYG